MNVAEVTSHFSGLPFRGQVIKLILSLEAKHEVFMLNVTEDKQTRSHV